MLATSVIRSKGRRVSDAPGAAAADRLDLAGRSRAQRVSRVLSHPRSTIRLLVGLARLPVLQLDLTESPGGLAISAAARQGGARGLFRSLARSVMVVPSSGVLFRGRRTHGL